MIKGEFIKNIDVNSLLKSSVIFSVFKQNVLSSFAVATKSFLKTTQKIKILKETASEHSYSFQLFSAFSLSLSNLFISLVNPVFVSKKTFGCTEEKQETENKQEKKKGSNVRSIIQSLPVEEGFFSLFFFLFMQKDFADSASCESSTEHSLSPWVCPELSSILPAAPSCYRIHPRLRGAT